MVIFIPLPLNEVFHKSAVIVVFSFDATNLYASAPAFIPAIVTEFCARIGAVDDELPSLILTVQVAFSPGPVASPPPISVVAYFEPGESSPTIPV